VLGKATSFEPAQSVVTRPSVMSPSSASPRRTTPQCGRWRRDVTYAELGETGSRRREVYPSTTRLRMTPTPSISVSTTFPGLR